MEEMYDCVCKVLFPSVKLLLQKRIPLQRNVLNNFSCKIPVKESPVILTKCQCGV